MWNWTCASEARFFVKFVSKNYQRNLFLKYVVCKQEKNGMRHEGKSCPSRNIYISEIWILLKTFSKKLGYILAKTCFTYFTYLLLQIKIVVTKTFNFKLENWSFTKLFKKYWWNMLYTNKVIINLKWSFSSH